MKELQYLCDNAFTTKPAANQRIFLCGGQSLSVFRDKIASKHGGKKIVLVRPSAQRSFLQHAEDQDSQVSGAQPPIAYPPPYNVLLIELN